MHRDRARWSARTSFVYASGVLVVLMGALMAAPTRDRARADTVDEARVGQARAAVKDLGEALKEQLVAAIKSGGPVAAIAVCRTIAPDLAKDKSQAHGLRVGRTALKVRNRANAPDAFERKVLEDFVKRIEAGADPAKLEHAEIVTEGGATVFRYMKAIPITAEPCLTCHGADLKPEVKAEISRLYPDDQATGFKAGELRGAFTVTQGVK